MKRQSGITLVGFVFILIIAGFFAYTAMKLVPAYLDFLSVSKALNIVATQSETGQMSAEEAHKRLSTQQISQYFDDEDINVRNISVKPGTDGRMVLRLRYDKQITWLYNIDFLLHFEKSVTLQPVVQ